MLSAEGSYLKMVYLIQFGIFAKKRYLSIASVPYLDPAYKGP